MYFLFYRGKLVKISKFRSWFRFHRIQILGTTWHTVQAGRLSSLILKWQNVRANSSSGTVGNSWGRSKEGSLSRSASASSSSIVALLDLQQHWITLLGCQCAKLRKERSTVFCHCCLVYPLVQRHLSNLPISLPLCLSIYVSFSLSLSLSLSASLFLFMCVCTPKIKCFLRNFHELDDGGFEEGLPPNTNNRLYPN